VREFGILCRNENEFEEWKAFFEEYTKIDHRIGLDIPSRFRKKYERKQNLDTWVDCAPGHWLHNVDELLRGLDMKDETAGNEIVVAVLESSLFFQLMQQEGII
jgi:hypothetical protein